MTWKQPKKMTWHEKMIKEMTQKNDPKKQPNKWPDKMTRQKENDRKNDPKTWPDEMTPLLGWDTLAIKLEHTHIRSK